MLHTEILEEKTLELLKKLMACKQMETFNLVGGTALSLNLGHRKSIDLDLFCKQDFDVPALRRFLIENFGFKERYTSNQTLKGEIDGIFIDCIKYDYPYIAEPANYDGIRITSIPDILAMKLSAITDSGTREKDFVDIAFFSTRYSLKEMLDFYTKKYNGLNELSPLKALLYFNDIKKNEPVNLISGKYRWKEIEQRLKEMVRTPEKKFSEFPCVSSVSNTVELADGNKANVSVYQTRDNSTAISLWSGNNNLGTARIKPEEKTALDNGTLKPADLAKTYFADKISTGQEQSQSQGVKR